jgi:hypothetical protein
MPTVIEDEHRGEHVATRSSKAEKESPNPERRSLEDERISSNHPPVLVSASSTDRNDERVYIEDEPLCLFDERVSVFAEPPSSSSKRRGEREERRRHVSATSSTHAGRRSPRPRRRVTFRKLR